jgi:hypothetical protein
MSRVSDFSGQDCANGRPTVWQREMDCREGAGCEEMFSMFVGRRVDAARDPLHQFYRGVTYYY